MNVLELLKNIDGVKEVKEMAENHRWFVYVAPNENDLEFLIELTFCFPDNSKNNLPNLWFKYGLIDRVLENYFGIDTYLTTEKGCFGGVNPTEINLGNRSVVNFENTLEITENNVKKIIEMTIREYKASEKKEQRKRPLYGSTRALKTFEV